MLRSVKISENVEAALLRREVRVGGLVVGKQVQRFDELTANFI